MAQRYIIDQSGSSSTVMEVPPFPWVRMDADRFVWEEVLFEGNYLAVHFSAMGRVQSRENIYQKLTRKRFLADHLFAFELEVDGQLLRDGWKWRQSHAARTEKGAEELIIELSCERPPITVGVHTLLDGTAFLTRWLEIRNDGERACRLSRVFPWAGIIGGTEVGATITTREPPRGFSLGRYNYHHWLMEGEFSWSVLQDATYTVRTRGNKFHPPLLIVRNNDTGEMTVIHVECTPDIEVSFTQAVEPSHRLLPSCPWGGRYLHAKAGLGGKPPHRVLQPGETATTPSVHLSMIYGDLDDCVNALHEHVRASVMPPQPKDKVDLVEYNHTGYTLNSQISKALLRQEVETAAEIGVELFLVDAGWFGPKDKSWGRSIGDWVENPLLGEGGLREVFDYARQKGMKCGLWMPPEVAGEDAPVVRAHPDWFRRAEGVWSAFDLLNPEVEEYVFNTICSAIERFGLDCYRIDAGSSDIGERTDAAGCQESISWRYFEKLYGIYERVRQRFPGLLLENCCGGGGRCDLAMLRRFHFTQITDNWAPPCQIRILNGMTLALTPQQCMPLVGSINMRTADIDFVIRTGLFGHFTVSGAFPNVPRANAPALGRWKHGIELYKQEIRPLLPNCRVFHHTPIQDFQMAGEWVVLEYASPDGSAAIVGVFRLAGSESNEYRLVPRGLNPSREYTVYSDNRETTTTASGAELRAVGITVRVAAPLMSELLVIKAVTKDK